MESHVAAPEELPALYRSILDRVARLEREGARREAAAIRAAASRAYAVWDENGRRQLAAILRRLDRSRQHGQAEPMPKMGPEHAHGASVAG